MMDGLEGFARAASAGDLKYEPIDSVRNMVVLRFIVTNRLRGVNAVWYGYCRCSSRSSRYVHALTRGDEIEGQRYACQRLAFIHLMMGTRVVFLTLLCLVARQPFRLRLVSQPPRDVASEDSVTYQLHHLEAIITSSYGHNVQERAVGKVQDGVGRLR